MMQTLVFTAVLSGVQSPPRLLRCVVLRGVLLVVALATAGCTLGCRTRLNEASASTQWLATWEGPPQLTEPRNLPPAPGLSGSTLRQRIHVSIGGTQWRVRLSNEFGDGPLAIRAARLARATRADSIDAASDVAMAFRGSASVTIPAGSAIISDPIALSAPGLSELAITLHIESAPTSITGHPGSRTTSYLMKGDHVAAPDLFGATLVEHWYVISRVDVATSGPAAAVVVLGNSIADGRGSGTDRNDRWPDNLARRLQANARTAGVAVLNAGIGGNAVVRGGLGPTALARLDRDVLSQPGARWLIVSDGVNDIGAATDTSSTAIADELIGAYRDIIRRAKARGFRVYGATMMPFGGSQYSSAVHEAARLTLNRWIRESRQFDAIIDFDVAMRDSANQSRLRSDVDGGDHLHPNEHGYRLMADAVDLGLFTASGR